MSEANSITVRVQLAVRRRPGRKMVVSPEGGPAQVPARTCADPALVKALARAFRYQRLLEEGRYASISEMAKAEKLDRGYLGRILQLTLLAPGVVEAVLDRRHLAEVRLPGLLEAFPIDWAQQKAAWLSPASHMPARIPTRS